MDKTTGALHNIVLVSAKYKEVFTFADVEKNIHTFCDQLVQNIPMLESYEQSWTDKLLRKRKI